MLVGWHDFLVNKCLIFSSVEKLNLNSFKNGVKKKVLWTVFSSRKNQLKIFLIDSTKLIYEQNNDIRTTVR